MSQRNETCCNCSGAGEVPAAIPCPECKGGHLSELIVLRELADYMRVNTLTRSRPPAELVAILKKLDTAQGMPPLLQDSEGWRQPKSARDTFNAWKNGVGR